MSWRPTGLALSFVTVTGWALVLGVLTGRAELVIAAVPLVVALLVGRRRGAAPALHVEHAVSAERLLEEERVTVRVRDVKWVGSAEFSSYPFPPADQKTMDQLLGVKRWPST